MKEHVCHGAKCSNYDIFNSDHILVRETLLHLFSNENTEA